MQNIKIISIIMVIVALTATTIGCTSKKQEAENQKILEAKIEEDNAKIEEENKVKLESLQPGVFKGEYSEIYTGIKSAMYKDLNRYPDDNLDKMFAVRGRVYQVDFGDNGLLEIYMYDEIMDQTISLDYTPAKGDASVLVDDYVETYSVFKGMVTKESTNGFGVKKSSNEPYFVVDKMLGQDFHIAKKKVEIFIGKAPELQNKYTWSLVGTSKDFEDLKDKRGYVFTLIANDGGANYEQYLYFDTKDGLRYFNPTINGKTIKGDPISISADRLDL